MAQNYLHTLIGEGAKALQEKAGSRESYARITAGATGAPDTLGERELAFIAARDSIYMASVTADGWPYVQHRGGPPGFLRSLGGNRLGFADYRGNRQYLSTANLEHDDRVALFLMDYRNRRRLKLIGHARRVTAGDDPALVRSLLPVDYPALPEQAWIIEIVGFEWNCPQHITPRFTEAEVLAAVAPLRDEIQRLRAELARRTETQA